MERAAEAFLRRDDVVAIPGAPGERRFTTASLLACERRIVTDALRGRCSGAGAVNDDALARSLGAVATPLNDEQRAAIRAIATSGNVVDVIEALAGTGKTTLAGALAAVYQDAGYHVLGAAPTGRAARELSSRAGVPTRTLHGLAEDLRKSDGFGPEPAVMLVDEAGMAPTRVSAHVLAAAVRDGVKVVALGDSGQLSSVEAGGWLCALSQRIGAHQLRSVVRQRDVDERQALAQVHDGSPDRWITLKQKRGELVVHHDGPQAAQEAAMAAWRADVDHVGVEQAIMIARDNATRARLNQQARQWRAHRSELGKEITVDGLEVAVGDRVIARRNDRLLDVDNGTRGTALDVDAETLSLTIETDTGDLRKLPADYVAAHLEHAYALTGHGSQGATVERAVIIGTPEDFTNEWAYTALSRARDPVTVHVVAEPADRSGRAEFAPGTDERTTEETIDRMRAAMQRREREDLAIDQVDWQCTSTDRTPVSAEAAAEAIERAQRRQLALDLDGASRAAEPVPEVLSTLRDPEPLSTIDRKVGLDAPSRAAIERARQSLTEVPREPLGARAKKLDALLETFPVHRAEATRRTEELARLRDEHAEAHERIGQERARLDELGPLSRVFARHEREFTEQALSNWSERAGALDERVEDLERQVDADRHARAAWLDEHGGELIKLCAAKVELHDRDDKARDRRIDNLRGDPPEWVTERLGQRPDDSAAREQWDRAAAHLDDYREAFGQPPGDARPRGDYRERRAWEQVHGAASRALEVHPERPVVQRRPPQLHRDIGLDIGR